MKVVSLKDHPYGASSHRLPGEVYELEDRWVEIFQKLELVRPAPARLQDKDIQAEEPRKYRRRDLKADD